MRGEESPVGTRKDSQDGDGRIGGLGGNRPLPFPSATVTVIAKLKLDRIWSFLVCSAMLFLLCFPIFLCWTFLFPDQTMFSCYGRNAMAAHNMGQTELSGEREVTGGLGQIHWGVFLWDYIKWLLCHGGPSALQCELPSAKCLSDSWSSCFSCLLLKSILEDSVCSRHCSANAEIWDTSGRTAHERPIKCQWFLNGFW